MMKLLNLTNIFSTKEKEIQAEVVDISKEGLIV